MSIRRSLTILLALALVLSAISWAGWHYATARLAEAGITDIELQGPDLGWGHLGFETVSFNWSNDDILMQVRTSEPSVHMAWSDFQVDSLTVGAAKVAGVIGSGGQQTGRSEPPGGLGDAFELVFPESAPFWLPGKLAVESLSASFPCYGGQCSLIGRAVLERGSEKARLNMDLELTRNGQVMALAGNLQVGSAGAEGELRLDGVRPWIAQAAEGIDQRLLPTAVVLSLLPGAETGKAGHWPMAFAVSSEGGAGLTLNGQAVLDTGDPWRLTVSRGRLTGRLPEWRIADWLLDRPAIDLALTGRVGSGEAMLRLGEGSALRVRHLDATESEALVWADNIVLQPAGLVLKLTQDGVGIAGPLQLSAEEIRYPGLEPQSWQLLGDVTVGGAAVRYQGDLSNESGAVADLDARYQTEQGVEAQAGMVLSSSNQANQMAKTLTQWPAPLSITEGQAELDSRLRWSPGTAPEVEAILTFTDAAGIYDRTAWSGMEGPVELSLDGERLQVSSRRLSLAQINPGLPIGPVELDASYTAPAASPAGGELRLGKASAGFAGGRVRVEPGTWSFTEPQTPWRVPVTLEDIELAELMNLYPAEGLSGNGTLSGLLPVTWGPGGVAVVSGRVEAQAPGGTLELPADRLRGLGQTNAAMELVAKAMEDFHYRRLESSINYTETGTLTLGLQLEGSSPNIDSERPVVLNINIEEDIPALLTSLQLSGRVNEAVTRRVRELMEDKESTP